MDEEFSSVLEHLEAAVSLLSIENMIKSGQNDDAIVEIERQLEAESMEFAPVWNSKLIRLFIPKNQYEAATTKINEFLNDLPAQLSNQMAWEIYEHAADSNEIPDELLNAANTAAEKALDEAPIKGETLDTLAHLLHLSGDLDRAIEVQDAAIENLGRAEAEIKDFLQQLLKEKDESDDS